MKIKVCGLKDQTNIAQLARLKLDYMGFIFHKQSLRTVDLSVDLINEIKHLNTTKVGVFVDETLDEILRVKAILGLDLIQLHGNETPGVCQNIQKKSPIIKVFKVDEDFDFSVCSKYLFSDYFLFDTKGKQAGGNGIKFQWSLLEQYKFDVPFFLSGGIRPSDGKIIRKLNVPGLMAIDINSGFEIEPGIKNVELVKEFKNELSTG